MSYFDLRDNVLDYDSQDCLGCLAVSSQDTQIYDLYLSDASFVISLESSSLTFKSKFGKHSSPVYFLHIPFNIFTPLNSPQKITHLLAGNVLQGQNIDPLIPVPQDKITCLLCGFFFFLFVCISSQRANPSILFLTLALNPALQMTFNTQQAYNRCSAISQLQNISNNSIWKGEKNQGKNNALWGLLIHYEKIKAIYAQIKQYICEDYQKPPFQRCTVDVTLNNENSSSVLS